MKNIIACSLLTFLMCLCIGCGNKEASETIDSYITAECTWAYDVTNPKVVIENNDYFVKVRVKSKDKTKYFVKNTIMPNSTYNVDVLEVVSSTNSKLPKNINIAVNGGVVTMKEYVNTLDSVTRQKTNTEKLSEKDLQKRVLISNESYYDLKPGNEYYISIRDLTQDNDYKGYYGMPEGGYDVFIEKDGAFVNVLTQQKLSK